MELGWQPSIEHLYWSRSEMATVKELFQMMNTLQGQHHALNQEISRLTAENQQFKQAGGNRDYGWTSSSDSVF